MITRFFKKYIFLFMFSSIGFSSFTTQENINFYAQPVKDHADLHWVMEKVTVDTQPLWRHYFSVQNNTQASSIAAQHQKGCLIDGTSVAYDVINTWQAANSTDVWVSYITRLKKPVSIQNSTDFYDYRSRTMNAH
jgi:hypothetical protein